MFLVKNPPNRNVGRIFEFTIMKKLKFLEIFLFYILTVLIGSFFGKVLIPSINYKKWI